VRIKRGRYAYFHVPEPQDYKTDFSFPSVLAWEGRKYELVAVFYSLYVGGAQGGEHFVTDLFIRGAMFHFDDIDHQHKGAAYKARKLANEKGGRKPPFVVGANEHPALCGLLYVVQEPLDGVAGGN
jgi:hypothetical protein